MRFGKNVIIFDVGNRSSSNPENHKNNLLILGERPACNINGRVGSQKKKIVVLILLKQTQIFVSFYIIILMIVICLLMGKKSLNFKSTIKMLTF